MPRQKRQYNTVRTDQFESLIGLYEAKGNYEAASALRGLARSVGAPIDEAVITTHKEGVRETLARWQQQDRVVSNG